MAGRVKVLKKAAIVIMIIAVAFTIIYVGLFLYGSKETPHDINIEEATSHEQTFSPIPINYMHIIEKVNGYTQQVHVLNIDISDSRVGIKPVLSFDKVFGFEKLSEMAKRYNAYAAVNAGFFYKYGQPSGMVVIDGKMYSSSTGKYPVFVVSDKEASLQEIKNKLWINYQGGRLSIDNINVEGKAGEIILYTPEYGSSNKAKLNNTTVIVRDNIVEQISEMKDEAEIPADGMLITFFNSSKTKIPFNNNDRIKFEFEPFMNSLSHAYECGSWIVREGQVVIGERDEWVGIMTNRDPRTAIGIKEDGTVVLFVVDGRQPGYSAGLKGDELGELLLKYEIVNAAMLDGGASTEMLLEGRLVNKPSFKGEERPLAGGILVQIKE